jgi:hypothetical protein
MRPKANEPMIITKRLVIKHTDWLDYTFPLHTFTAGTLFCRMCIQPLKVKYVSYSYNYWHTEAWRRMVENILGTELRSARILNYGAAYMFDHANFGAYSGLTERHITKKFLFLTFRGPCIVIYSYNKSQRDALFLRFIFIKNSTYFGKIYCPSSGVSTLYTHQ